jgi:hypothetical protein
MFPMLIDTYPAQLKKQSCTVQVKYLDAEGINFGLQRESREELPGLETAIHKLLNTSSYKAYDLEDWSLAVDLKSHICFPEGSGAVAVEFMVQV